MKTENQDNNSNSVKALGGQNVGLLLVRLSVPAIVAQLVNALYNIVDRIYVGHIPGQEGVTSLEALGVAFPIILIISAFSYFVGMGGSPLASIAMGEKNNGKAEKILGNSVTMLVVLAIVIFVVMQIFIKPCLYLVGASPTDINFAVTYMRIYLIGTLPVLIALGLNPFITTQGFAITGMVTVLIGAVCNIVLDPVFIFGFGMGVSGAATATVISQTISAIWVCLFFWGKKSVLRLRKMNLKPDFGIVKKIVGLGISPFVMQATESLILIVYNANLLKYGGDIAVTSMTVLSSTMQFVTLPMMGLMQGSQPIISYNFGAKKFGRIKKCFKYVLCAGIIYTACIWIGAEFFPQYIAGIFTNDTEVINYTVHSMRLYLFAVVFISIQMSCQQMFVSTGFSKKALFNAFMRKIILLIPLILIMGMLLGADGIFLAEPMADITACIIAAAMLYRSRKDIFADGLDAA